MKTQKWINTAVISALLGLTMSCGQNLKIGFDNKKSEGDKTSAPVKIATGSDANAEGSKDEEKVVDTGADTTQPKEDSSVAPDDSNDSKETTDASEKADTETETEVTAPEDTEESSLTPSEITAPEGFFTTDSEVVLESGFSNKNFKKYRLNLETGLLVGSFGESEYVYSKNRLLTDQELADLTQLAEDYAAAIKADALANPDKTCFDLRAVVPTAVQFGLKKQGESEFYDDLENDFCLLEEGKKLRQKLYEVINSKPEVDINNPPICLAVEVPTYTIMAKKESSSKTIEIDAISVFDKDGNATQKITESSTSAEPTYRVYGLSSPQSEYSALQKAMEVHKDGFRSVTIPALKPATSKCPGTVTIHVYMVPVN